MKDNDDLNKKIDEYYDGLLEKNHELNNILEKMNVINDIEEKVQLNINIDETLKRAEDIRIKKYTKRFIAVAIAFSLVMLFLASKLNFENIIIIQSVMLVLLLAVNIFLRSNNLKENGNE